MFELSLWLFRHAGHAFRARREGERQIERPRGEAEWRGGWLGEREWWGGANTFNGLSFAPKCNASDQCRSIAIT